MRIFETATYNLNQIKFKDNKAFFDDLLNKLKISYDNVGFGFQGTNSTDCFSKLLTKYPQFEKYHKKPISNSENVNTGYEISSVSGDWGNDKTVHIDPQDVVALEEILQKIPHTYNYWSMTVVLDNVHWGNGTNTSPLIHPTAMGDPRAHCDFFNYYSNHIKFTKEFDFGNKLNKIEIITELEGNTEWVSEVPEGFEQIVTLLGKPKYRTKGCFFDVDEHLRLEKLKSEFRERLKQDDYQKYFSEFQAPKPQTSQDVIMHVVENLVPVSGISPKKIIIDVAKKSGFKYTRCHNQMYTTTKKLDSNHIVKVDFLIRPFSTEMCSNITVSSYNFHISIPVGPTTIYAKTDADIEQLARRTYECAESFIKKHERTLLDTFGKGVNW